MRNFFEKIDEIKQKKNGKAILFFGFYLVFFLILFISLKFSNKRPLSAPEDYEKGNRYKFYINDIVDGNYHYNYVTVLDGVRYEYSGERNKKEELFRFNSKEYYKNDGNYFVNEGLWIKSDNPFVYQEFLDVDNIVEMIGLAAYESNTNYEDGRQSYKFLISSNTLNQKLHNIESDFMEEPNQLFIMTDANKNVTEISLKLDSYCTMNKLCKGTLEINLTYDKFGDIEDIESPIE